MIGRHAAWLLALFAAGTAAGVRADAPAHLVVTGDGGRTATLDAAALDRLPQRRVEAEAHGRTFDCRGANLIDVLVQAGAPSGAQLRGKALARYVRIRAADGYEVVYALAELDPQFRGDAVPVLTHECNGAPLDAKDGPFRIVAPGDKLPARWIRQVSAIELLRAP